MKKYSDLNQSTKQQLERMKDQYDKLILFQHLLLTCEVMKERYLGNEKEIASGLDPWVETLKELIDRN